ncbi:transmembrane 220 family protein [Pontibacter beigongshangensis]|uniref:transmembrane 220 family protein n=1 Tax=Pontibacter beigongshangensis TaxID=2574733 RepID=UPI00164F7863|nr:transmembrane 220 family protein [Pontibacter beigongshangensis]
MKLTSIFYGFWCLAFLLFTYWQLNDPDAWLWLLIYGFAALMCGLAAFGIYFRYVLTAFAVLFLFGFALLYPSSVSDWIRQEWAQKDLSMKTNAMEQARESFGLLVAGIMMALAAATGWQKHRQQKALPQESLKARH